MKEKSVRVCVGIFCLFLLTPAMPLRRVASAPSPETYKQDAQGLEKQFEPFLKAFQKGDDKGMDESFGVFRLPKPKEWFGNYFSVEDAAKLSSVYDREITDAESSLIEDMNRADPGSRFRVRCEPRGESGAGQDSSGGYGLRPVKPIAVEQFRLEFRSGSHDQKFSFIANFVYVDGAYRFVGGGGAAFWAKPEAGR
ncbi:MAG TPA: hypothetical protein VG075_16105 [Candidatus Acidoferrum sp.]|nr:hypothetical protein [Candidatus Acidoferrum sp.]